MLCRAEGASRCPDRGLARRAADHEPPVAKLRDGVRTLEVAQRVAAPRCAREQDDREDREQRAVAGRTRRERDDHREEPERARAQTATQHVTHDARGDGQRDLLGHGAANPRPSRLSHEGEREENERSEEAEPGHEGRRGVAFAVLSVVGGAGAGRW